MHQTIVFFTCCLDEMFAIRSSACASNLFCQRDCLTAIVIALITAVMFVSTEWIQSLRLSECVSAVFIISTIDGFVVFEAPVLVNEL